MKIVLGSDHAGKELRLELVNYLTEIGHEITDCGTHQATANYANEGIRVAENVSQGNHEIGIVICGSGIGISIAANKVRGIRCAMGYNKEVAGLARVHNNANILALGARFVTVDEAKEIVNAYLDAEFEGGRHEDRIHTISDYEESCVDC